MVVNLFWVLTAEDKVDGYSLDMIRKVARSTIGYPKLCSEIPIATQGIVSFHEMRMVSQSIIVIIGCKYQIPMLNIAKSSNLMRKGVGHR